MSNSVPVLTDLDFHYVRHLAKVNSAIVIGEDKRYLVETRLSPLAEQTGFHSLAALIDALRVADKPGPLHVRTIDALTTNETSFFRDRYPFEAFGNTVLPRLIEARKSTRRLRIWSAAASTGQEAYSISMLIRERYPELLNWDVRIIGTDISETVLKQARDGIYGQHEVARGLPSPLLAKYFLENEQGRWQIRPEIRSMTEFLPINLIGHWPSLPVFDFIFIRNVLIYFDLDDKRKILSRICQNLAEDGLLALGTAESTVQVTQLLLPTTIDKAVFFQKTNNHVAKL